jgi:hypothetical protein
MTRFAAWCIREPSLALLADGLSLAVFVGVGLGMSALVAQLHRARRRAEAEAAEQVAQRIQSQVRVRVAELPDGKDPDELPLSQVKDLVQGAPLVGDLRRRLAKAGVT